MIVFGIDCFICVGFKEFWVYIWVFNDKLFFFGVNIYLFICGIWVEFVVIIFIFFVGIVF